MASVDAIVRQLIALRASGTQITLLAVCPNSDAVLEAAVKVAARNNMPMLFAATLNQVDRDGGYTGWDQSAFVKRISELAEKHGCTAPLYPCLDHGGPWLKDAHSRDRLSLSETMGEVKASIAACLEAGYSLLHIDPTVDRSLPGGRPPETALVVGRTVELIGYAEAQRRRRGLPGVSYEVGTEEVHGGLADIDNFDRFLTGLRRQLGIAGLESVWPCFVVGKVGTDLHTTTFDGETARRLHDRVAPLGSLIKGHYTDWVENPQQYPASGMGGANVGPEFTATELAALRELSAREVALARAGTRLAPSRFEAALEAAVVASRRWQKWLLPEEAGGDLRELSASRREWLIATGARYVWADARVIEARQQLYKNLATELAEPHAFVVERIGLNMQKYVDAFNLQDSLPLLSP